MLGRITLGLMVFGGLALAEQVAIPLGEAFQHTPLFDELDVTLQSTGNVFVDASPLVIEGLGTEDWLSFFVESQLATSNGSPASGLTALKLNLLTKTDPIRIILRLRFKGSDVRAVQYDFNGTEWFITEVPLSDSGSGATGSGGLAGGGGLGGPGGTGGTGDGNTGGPGDGNPGGPGDGNPGGPGDGNPGGPGDGNPGGPGDGNPGGAWIRRTLAPWLPYQSLHF